MQLYNLTCHQLSKFLQERQVSAVEVTKAAIERIEAVDAQVQAFITQDREQALEQAREIDKARAQGKKLGPLAGIPMALKDNICTQGIKTTCASRMLAAWVPPYNATVVHRLKKAGAVILGKLNMDEFAAGSSTETSAFYSTRNPWDLKKVSGGSSGGSAAAVAAGEVCYSLGSDTGGSVRQPAAFCGVVGMKPTYGRVSRYGLIAFASSMDQIGPVTQDVTDCAMVLGAIAGHDACDSTSSDLPVPNYQAALQKGIKGLKVGIPREYFIDAMDSKVETVLYRAIAKLEELGAVCEEVSLPHTEYALPVYYSIASAEASSNLARYDGVGFGLRVSGRDMEEIYSHTRREGLGPEIKRRVMLGTYILSANNYENYYLQAAKVRTLIRQDFEAVFAKYDILAAPTTPTTAFCLGEETGDPLALYANDFCTCPVNLAGLPAISLPCGFVRGLPVGLQLIGKAFDEARLLQAAFNFEQNTEYHRRRPELGVDK